MMLRNVLLAGAAVAVIGAVTVPAHATTIVDDTWYTASFTAPGSNFFAATALGYNPPSWRNFTSVNAGTGPYTITLAHPEYLLITDLEISGDQFTLGFSGATNGTVTTSTPVVDYSRNIGEDISTALALSDYSHGYYLLNAGTTTISTTFDGVIDYGNVSFSVAAPEPSTWAMLLFGFAGLGFAGYRKAKGAALSAI